MIYIETPRLLLRDWKEEDLVPFAKMNCNPHVMKYFPKPLTKSESFGGVFVMKIGIRVMQKIELPNGH